MTLGTKPLTWSLSLVVLLLFNLAYLFWAARQIQQKSDGEFLLYICVVGTLLAVVLFLHRKFSFSIYSLWGMSFWGLFHMLGGLWHVPAGWPLGGEKAVLYNWWVVEPFLKFDQFVHAFGFGMTTWIVWQAVRASLHKHGSRVPSKGGMLFVCALASMGLGSINEIIEFVATCTLPQTNVGGYVNTSLDLVFNMVGAFLTATVLYFFDREGRVV